MNATRAGSSQPSSRAAAARAAATASCLSGHRRSPVSACVHAAAANRSAATRGNGASAAWFMNTKRSVTGIRARARARSIEVAAPILQ